MRWRAARTSSTRPTGVLRGAAWAAVRPVGHGRRLGDVDQGPGQGLERLRALGLGGLDHERLVDDEREVHRRGVEPFLEEAFGHVEGPDAGALLEAGGGGHELVHAHPVVGQVVDAPQSVAEPVGVEDGGVGHPPQPVAAVGQHVGVGPGQGQGVAVPAVDPSDRARRVLPAEAAVTIEAAPAAGREGRAPTRPSPPPGPRPDRRPRGGRRTSCGGSSARCRSPCRPVG